MLHTYTVSDDGKSSRKRTKLPALVGQVRLGCQQLCQLGRVSLLNEVVDFRHVEAATSVLVVFSRVEAEFAYPMRWNRRLAREDRVVVVDDRM